MKILRKWKKGKVKPDKSWMTGEGSDAKVFPPPTDLLAEHNVHQLGVCVVHLQGCLRAVRLVVDVVQADLAPGGKHGGGVD